MQLQKKLVSFLTALPSGADFLELAILNRISTRPVEITGLIVTSQGITECSAPADAENVEAFAGSFKFDKGEAMSNFDAAGYSLNMASANPILPSSIDLCLPSGKNCHRGSRSRFLSSKISTSTRLTRQIPGVFLRLSLQTAEEQQRYRDAYQEACYSGMQVQQTFSEPQADGSQLVGLWLDCRLVEPLQASIEAGCRLKDALSREDSAKVARKPRP